VGIYTKFRSLIAGLDFGVRIGVRLWDYNLGVK
jgi:hypothetical protein